MGNTMKALQMARPLATSVPTLSVVTVPIPTIPPGHALVKVHYSVIQPSDKLNSIGGFPKTTFPRIPGRDFSGVVVDAADPSTGWVGKEVYGTSGGILGFKIDGPHAQYCLIPENMLVERPERLSFLQAATVGVHFTTALRCLRRARASREDLVLVLGASGAVGSSAVQVAKAMGCKKVLTASRKQGDNPDVLLTEDPQADFQRTIPALTDGKGVDVVIDTIGNLSLMGTAISQLALKGRYAWIASPRGGLSTQLNIDIFFLYRQEIELVGCNTGLATEEDVAKEMQILTGWFNHGLLNAREESAFKQVGLEDAIQKGYRMGPGEKQVVISML